MGWDISVIDPNTKETCLSETQHALKGGSYIVGELGDDNTFTPGTKELWLSVTHNYNKYFFEVLGDSLEFLDGKTVKETLEKLRKATADLAKKYDNPTVSERYWDATPGNALKALQDLVQLAEMAPENAVWNIWG